MNLRRTSGNGSVVPTRLLAQICTAAAVILGVLQPVHAYASSADVLVNMTVSPNPVTAGGNVTYHITTSNNGPDGATNVTVTDVLPGSLHLCVGDPYTRLLFGHDHRHLLVWGTRVERQRVGGRLWRRHRLRGTVNNTASVTATEPDPDTSNNSVTKSVTANVGANLSIGISGSPSTVAAGATLTYTITSLECRAIARL